MGKRKYTTDQLTEAAKASQSVKEVLTKLGLSSNGGGAHKHITSLLKELPIDVSHLLVGNGKEGKHRKPKDFEPAGTTPLAEAMTEDSDYCAQTLKKRLIRWGMIENRCSKCNQGPEWQGEPLTLHIDHINGNKRDHRRFNLRILCPNCHSQTMTFAGRNKGRNI